MDAPEDDGVDVDRHGVARQGLLGVEGGGLDALVDHRHHLVEDREDQEQARALDALQLAGPQDHELLPGVGHLQAQRHQDRGQPEGHGLGDADEPAEEKAGEDQGKGDEGGDRVHGALRGPAGPSGNSKRGIGVPVNDNRRHGSRSARADA